ncbi:YibE/F family protein [Intrasporangium calvum]|uniref:YibE/F family protein n=1 Tax=Intrasporangium calvum TaxID=53358 RepID=UPI001F466323|nr:YibE/F family protein [Intrasporangium calvum]
MPGGHLHSQGHHRSGAHSHGHGHGSGPQVEVGSLAKLALIAFLILTAAGTVFGLVRYWPSGASAADRVGSSDFAAPGVTFPIATVSEVLPPCAGAESQVGAAPLQNQRGDVAADSATCGAIRVNLEPETGDWNDQVTVTISVPGPVSTSGLQAGDKVQLLKIPAQGAEPAAYSFLQVQRGAPLALLLALFVLVVAVVARLRGVLALVGLGFGGLLVIKFMLPALLEGQPGMRVALIASTAIMFVVLYLTHGLSTRTSTALAGTFFGLAITAVLGVLAVHLARLSGVADDEGAMLVAFNETMRPRDLLTAAIIVAGLGVLNDVTITQSSAVWELRAAAPHLSRRTLFSSGMRIGRDHIASTIYTIVFAYAGAALPVLLLLFLYERPVLDLLQAESMSEEIVRTLASAIGLVLAVPATTAIAALTVGRARDPEILPTEYLSPDGDAGRGEVDASPTTDPTLTVSRPVDRRAAGRPRGPSATELQQRAAQIQRPPTSRSELRSRSRR